MDIEASNTKAPEDGWLCPKCVIVVAGTKPSVGGGLFASPQSDSQSVKVGGLYLSDGVFFPDIYFCDVFNFSIIKDTLTDRVPGIDCKLRKVNVSTSYMRINIRNTKNK